MKRFGAFAALCLMTVFLYGGQNRTPLVPQTFPPPGQTSPNPTFPGDQPPTVVHGSHRQAFQAKQAEKQAQEMARLAQSVPPEINKVAQGQLPKDLLSRLKRIEKLSKQLRREMGR
jgi:hypothetical protein